MKRAIILGLSMVLAGVAAASDRAFRQVNVVMLDSSSILRNQTVLVGDGRIGTGCC